MTLKQLEALLGGGHLRQFRRGRRARPHLSVSSLSKRIAELEEALGQLLFDRSGHKAR